MKIKIISFLLVSVSLVSCFKEPEFSLTPSIEFDNYTSDIRLDAFLGATKDSVVVTVRFQDGDGDLGLDEESKREAQKTDDFNYLVRPFRKVNGTFQSFVPGVPFSGYFPQLKLDEKPGPIEGTLGYTIEFIHAFTPKRDTVKFEIQIKDRAGNLSNTVETDEIILNRI